MSAELFTRVQSVAIGGVFVVAAVGKLSASNDQWSKSALARLLGRVPGVSVGFWRVSWAAAELILAGPLIIGIVPRAAAGIAAFIFGGGTVYLFWAMRRYPGAGCGCFGGKEAVSGADVIRCVVLMLMSATVLEPVRWERLQEFGIAGPLLTCELILVLSLTLRLWRSDRRQSIIRELRRSASVAAVRLRSTRSIVRALERTGASAALVEACGCRPEDIRRPRAHWTSGLQHWLEYASDSPESSRTVVVVVRDPKTGPDGIDAAIISDGEGPVRAVKCWPFAAPGQ
jgi:hypothetical protein